MRYHHQDSSSDDVPYLPRDLYEQYQSQNSLSKLSQQQQQQRQGRSHFSDDEIQELDRPIDGNDFASPVAVSTNPNNRIQRPDVLRVFPTGANNLNHNGIPRVPQNMEQVDLDEPPVMIPPPPPPRNQPQPQIQPPPEKISWGRRVIGILLILIPAGLFSVAVHIVDSVIDFPLFSASFFIFQGVFWPSFGILLTDLFCVTKKNKQKSSNNNAEQLDDEHGQRSKWIQAIWTIVHSNLAAAAMILQLLSIQRLNISVSLALSFGYDVVIILIRYIMQKKICSGELILLAIVSYVGYGVAAVPAFVASKATERTDVAIGVGASVGVMLLSIPSSFLLTHLRRQNSAESVLASSFAIFGCIQALITKEIMGDSFNNMSLDARSVGWALGIVSVVFLGTIFLFLEARLGSLVWRRDSDDDDDNDDESQGGCSGEFSSITRTRIAVFILSCLWEFSRQAFRNVAPDPFDILGGLLVIFSFFLAIAFQAWDRFHTKELQQSRDRFVLEDKNDKQDRPKFCAFVPWLFSQNK